MAQQTKPSTSKAKAVPEAVKVDQVEEEEETAGPIPLSKLEVKSTFSADILQFQLTF